MHPMARRQAPVARQPAPLQRHLLQLLLRQGDPGHDPPQRLRLGLRLLGGPRSGGDLLSSRLELLLERLDLLLSQGAGLKERGVLA